MATVHLPFGYPILSGKEFDVLVFQGTVVRRYVVETDPRSGSQLFNRRMLSDVSRMRTQLGDFVRGACRTVLGSRWSGNLTQVIRADLSGKWTEFESQFEEFDNDDKIAWRNVAPYQATFNDCGKLFFCLVRIIYDSLLSFSSFEWGGSEFGAAQSAQALAWFQRDLTGVNKKGSLNPDSSEVTWVGPHQTVNDGNAWDGSYETQTMATGRQVSFYFFGDNFGVAYVQGPDFGSCRIFVDGILRVERDQYHASYVYLGENWGIELSKGLHYVVFTGVQGLYNIDNFTVQ